MRKYDTSSRAHFRCQLQGIIMNAVQLLTITQYGPRYRVEGWMDEPLEVREGAGTREEWIRALQLGRDLSHAECVGIHDHWVRQDYATGDMRVFAGPHGQLVAERSWDKLTLGNWGSVSWDHQGARHRLLHGGSVLVESEPIWRDTDREAGIVARVSVSDQCTANCIAAVLLLLVPKPLWTQPTPYVMGI